MNKKLVAIIGFDSLRAFALKNIIKNNGNYSYSVSTALDSISTNHNTIELYIVTADIYIANIEYFLPQKNRVVVFSNEDTNLNGTTIQISFSEHIEVIEQNINNILSFLHKNDNTNNTLSAREIDVLREIATGKINKEIADCLNISINTVLTHRKNISSKLGIRTVSGLSLYAMMNGII